MKIRKQVYELTIDDLNRYPVWEFALDEEGETDQDEATVRPYPVNGALAPSEGMFVIRARFTFADGTDHVGYITPASDSSDLGTVQPQIVNANGQVGFWMGMRKPTIEPFYAKLGKIADQVFPIEWTSEVELAGGTMEGKIPAFLYYEDFKTRKVGEIK